DQLSVEPEYALATAQSRCIELLRRGSGVDRDLMNPDSLPEGIITRFRQLSLERIARVESVWNALVQGAEDEEAVRAASRDLHTLKGDARIVGFDEVHVLSHKLEELLAVASQVNYRVSDDFDLVVTMATQFVGMLLRKKSGGASGIDVEGFVRQVDDV